MNIVSSRYHHPIFHWDIAICVQNLWKIAHIIVLLCQNAISLYVVHHTLNTTRRPLSWTQKVKCLFLWINDNLGLFCRCCLIYSTFQMKLSQLSFYLAWYWYFCSIFPPIWTSGAMILSTDKLGKRLDVVSIGVLVANKTDLEERRVVSSAAGEAFAQSKGLAYFECSAVSVICSSLYL